MNHTQLSILMIIALCLGCFCGFVLHDEIAEVIRWINPPTPKLC